MNFYRWLQKPPRRWTGGARRERGEVFLQLLELVNTLAQELVPRPVRVNRRVQSAAFNRSASPLRTTSRGPRPGQPPTWPLYADAGLTLDPAFRESD